MRNPLILTFDVGTQSLRALLVSKSGDIVDSVQQIYAPPYYSSRADWAEQKPDYYFEQICEASMQLKRRQQERFKDVVAVAMTVFRDSTVCLDTAGKPLRDCILWLDRREAKNPKPQPAFKRFLFGLVGMGDTVRLIQHSSVCNWLAENEPDLWAKTDKYVMLSSYLNLRLTGRLADSDAAQMGHIPFDYKNRKWDSGSLTRDVYDISQGKLCELVPSGTVLGRVTDEASGLSGIPAGLPLVATGADKACETIGLSVIRGDQAAISFGSAASVEFISKKYFEPSLFMPCYPAVPSGMYNGEVQIFCGYWMLTWFKRNFAQPECEEAQKLGCAAEQLLDRHLGEVPAGCNGLMLLPYWCPGIENPDARGALVGFREGHGRYHVYRAIIEGVNFGLMEGLRRMEKRSGQKIREIFAGGGGSRSNEVCQITADMFGLPVKRIHTPESASLGAAMCAFVTMGEFPSYEQAAAEMVRVRDVFTPDKATHTLYERLFEEVYLKLYKTLRPVHRGLTAITRQNGVASSGKETVHGQTL